MKKYTVVHNRSKWVFKIFSITSFSISILITFLKYKEGYEYIFLIPIVASICFFMMSLSNVDYKNNVGTSFIIVLMFIRYTLHPFLFGIGNYTSAMGQNVSSHINSSIWLLIYEMFAITITIILASKKRLKKTVISEHKRKISLKMLRFILLSLSIFCIAVLVLIPNTKEIFRTIFDLSDPSFTSVLFEKESPNSTVRIAQTLFSMFFHFLRIMIPAAFLFYLYKKGRSENAIYLFALFFGFVQFLFITSTFAESIISAVVIFLVAIKLCPQGRKKMIITSILASCGVFVLFFTVRYNVKYGDSSSTDGLSYISKIVSAYFTGIDNVASIFLVPPEYKWSALFYNLYGTIPFNTTLFGLVGYKLQYYFNVYSNSYGQIVPSIASGYYFFGALLAPLFSVIQVYWAVRNGIIAHETKYYWKNVVHTFLAIMFSLGIAMYSETIVLSWFTTWGLPMYIISCFSNDLLKKEGIIQ